VVWERTVEGMQEMIEQSSQATQYYSDAFDVYERLVYYPGHHDVAPGKSQTSSVEGKNANLISGTIWRVWRAKVAASPARSMPYAAPSNSSFMPGTGVSSTNASTQLTPAM